MGLFNILGRYVARRFLTTILGTFMLCTLLIFMIDFVEMLRQSGKYGSVPVWKLAWLTIMRLPAYTEILLGFAVLVGAIAALLLLSRKSELTIMRAAGMSVWQFLAPGLLVAFVLGVASVTLYNPLAATARAESDKMFAEVFGRETGLQRSASGYLWLRQDGVDGPSVLSASDQSERGLKLHGVTVFQFDKDGHFVERTDARVARLMSGYWQLSDAFVARVGREPERFETYLLSTYLSPERVADALGTVIAVSFYELPGLIEVAEKAGLSPTRYRIQYEMLLSRPMLMMAMVLLGATVSLRSFRFGKIQTMVITGMLGGVGFFLLAEVSRQVGVAGLVSAWMSIWQPVLLVALTSLTVLLHQEDG